MRRSLIGIAGTGLGLLFLWLALRRADAEALHDALRSLDLEFTLEGVFLYWLALGLRVRRWQRLLGHLGVVRWSTVAGILGLTNTLGILSYVVSMALVRAAGHSKCFSDTRSRARHCAD